MRLNTHLRRQAQTEINQWPRKKRTAHFQHLLDDHVPAQRGRNAAHLPSSESGVEGTSAAGVQLGISGFTNVETTHEGRGNPRWCLSTSNEPPTQEAGHKRERHKPIPKQPERSFSEDSPSK